MADEFDRRNYGRQDSLGQPESMRNEEQKLRDNQGGSELTDLPDDHPAGAPGETASAEAEGPPPDQVRGQRSSLRSMGPTETTLPEASPLDGEDDISPFDDERGE